MEINPKVHAYEVDWEYDEPIGIQVIETDEATVLFGAGTADAADEIADIATDHHVDVVIVEHGDVDHYGGVPVLRGAIDDLEVAVPAGDVSFLEDAGIKADTLLDAGETYGGIETIAAPGHTPDNMAYLYEDILVAGDTVVGSESPFAADGDWSGPLAVITSDFNHDDDLTRQSVSNLAEYDFDVVLMSHGENLTEGGRDALATLLEDLE
ncbi:MAG: MBL fold metallo-hydrolase [Natronomonas sp.]